MKERFKMLASHMITVDKKDRVILDELKAKGYLCIAEAKALTKDMCYFSLDVNEELPINGDSRVSTYIISVPDKSHEPYKIVYASHPDRRIVDWDSRD